MVELQTKFNIMRRLLISIKDGHGDKIWNEYYFNSLFNESNINKYIKELINRGLVFEVENASSFYITNKGRLFLKKYGLIEEFVISFGLNNVF